MEFRYKYWCGRAERGRRASRLAGATVVGPVTARADQLWHAETGPPVPGPNLAADQLLRDRTSYGASGPVMARRNWSTLPNLAADQLLRDSPSSVVLGEWSGVSPSFVGYWEGLKTPQGESNYRFPKNH